jgi:hypothetical protein
MCDSSGGGQCCALAIAATGGTGVDGVWKGIDKAAPSTYCCVEKQGGADQRLCTMRWTSDGVRMGQVKKREPSDEMGHLALYS